MNVENISSFVNEDFESNIKINIQIDGLVFLENEDKMYELYIKKNDIVEQNETLEIMRPYIETKLKKYIIKKIKENVSNVVELSRKYNIPVKNILYCYFINNRIENIEIQWGGLAIKEFRYVPLRHYVEYPQETILLKMKGLKFKKKL
jgi:hypothetical protein